jgi:hypothetical protein
LVSLFRRRRLPATQRPALGPEERVVAWGGATGGDVLVATNHGLWLPGADGRLGWHQIHRATWSGRQLSLVAAREVAVADGYAVMADAPPVVHTLLDPDRVPEQVRARVTRSIAYTAHHRLPAGGGVRVVARRVPGVDGLRWTVRFDRPDDDTAEARKVTAELVAQGRASL